MRCTCLRSRKCNNVHTHSSRHEIVPTYLVVEVLVTENQVTSSVVIVQSVTHQRPRVMTSNSLLHNSIVSPCTHQSHKFTIACETESRTLYGIIYCTLL